MIPRHIVLVFMLVMLLINAQFESNQKFSIVEANPIHSRRKRQILDKEDAIKERIILSQEKNIQQLNKLVQSLRRQLLHCQSSNNSTTDVP